MMTSSEKLEHALTLINEQKYQDALTKFSELINSNPEEPVLYESLVNVGFIYYQHQQFDDATHYLTLALNLQFTEYHADINRLLGFIYIMNGRYDIASEHLLESLTYFDFENLESAIVKFELGKLLLELNDLDLSYNYLKESEIFFKDHNTEYYHSVLYYLGMNAFMKEEIELAESYFNVLLLNRDIKNSERVHGYFGALHIANYHKNADEIFNLASKILELDSNFYDRETLIYMTVRAYEYQNREQEYFSALDLFINDFPEGKFSEEYQQLKNKEFGSVK